MTRFSTTAVATRFEREARATAAARPLVELSDEQLLALAKGRANGVEAMLHQRFSPLVHRLVWRLLGPDSEYQDTTHDAFIRIFRGIPGLRDAGRLEEWVARVTINTVKNEFRKRRIRRFVSWDAWEDPGPLAYYPDFEHRELLAHTYRALGRLPASERIVLSLDLFESISLSEIAASVGVSVRTVKRRLQAARGRFERTAMRDSVLAPLVVEQKARSVRS